MNSFKPTTSRLLFATALVAMSAALAACDQVVSSANAQTLAPVMATEVVYVGDEYAVVQAQLGVEATPPAPSF
jgi:basic membrane lipoprotein Med (substrate-binding protein (PBP1-ABC) superfamily)